MQDAHLHTPSVSARRITEMRIEKKKTLFRFQDAAATSPLQRRHRKTTLTKNGKPPIGEGPCSTSKAQGYPRRSEPATSSARGQNPRSIFMMSSCIGSARRRFNHGSDLSFLLQPLSDKQHVAPTGKNVPNTHCI
jgi:hypothetical protein